MTFSNNKKNISTTKGSLRVKDIMTRDVITVSPDSPLSEVKTILMEKRISGIPVVDDNGGLAGVITITDLLKILDSIYKWKEAQKQDTELSYGAMLEEERNGARVKDYMAKSVCTLREEDTLDDIMRMMFGHGVHTLPVVKDEKLVGVIGKRDLIFICF